MLVKFWCRNDKDAAKEAQEASGAGNVLIVS
jgi:hypothetical protein